MILKLQNFTTDIILDSGTYSGRYVYLLNNSHIVLINNTITYQQMITGSELSAGIDTENYLTGLGATFDTYNVGVSSLIGQTYPVNFDEFIVFNASLDGGFGVQSKDLPLDFSAYIFDNLVPLSHYDYTDTTLVALEYFKNNRIDITKTNIDLLETPVLSTMYESTLMANFSFLSDIEYYRSLDILHIEYFRAQFSGFMELIGDVDVFCIKSRPEYNNRLPNQSLRDEYFYNETNKTRYAIDSAFDELINNPTEAQNTSEIVYGLELFSHNFFNLKLEI